MITSGSLPAGLNIIDDDGYIFGTPTTPGTSTFTVTATDSGSPYALSTSATLSIVVSGPPLTFPYTLDTVLGLNVYPNVPFSYQPVATGGQGPYTWSVPKSGGSLPGISINPSTGLISGTTLAANEVVYFTVVVTDSLHETASRTCS